MQDNLPTQFNTFVFPIRVYYEDTDAGGIVYYANYLKFLERGRTEWLRSLGVEQDGLLEQNIAFVVKAVHIDYKAPARFNECLSVHSQIVELKRASLRFRQWITNNDNQTVVEATVTVACVNIATMRPHAIPTFITGEIASDG